MTGFGDIIGHEQIIEHFRSALKNHQVSHAYILNGENGSGKNMLAKAFAKALVCEAGYGDSCNMCRAIVYSLLRPSFLIVCKIDFLRSIAVIKLPQKSSLVFTLMVVWQ